ncbi:MAG: hypothetical protein RLZZ618_3356, partial [Pseudomonadota bacterium]
MTAQRPHRLSLIQLSMASVAMVALSACGGGGESGTAAPAPSAPTAQLPSAPAAPTPSPSPSPSPSAPAPSPAAPAPAPAPGPTPAPAPADTQVPTTPSSFAATAMSASRIDLGWSASSDNVGVTGYIVTRCQGTGCTPDTQVAAITGTSFSDTGLSASSAYVYRVVARDAANLRSSAASATASTQAGTTPVGTGPNVSVAGAVTTPNPTLQNATVEWAFTGDANANAEVGVRYRVQGQSTWSVGMPLRRVTGGSSSGFSWATRHSGSVFDLQPGTTYDIELALRDPDGGNATRTVAVTTRSVPVAAANGTVKNATPSTLATVLSAAVAGDIIQLAAGSYAAFSIERDGTPGRPLVIRGTSGAVITGELAVYNRHDILLDSITVNGAIRFNGTNNMSVVRSTINSNASVRNGDGIVTYLRSENSYIADNVLNGTTAWADAAMGVNGNNRGEGIQVTGPGHVIMNNRVSGYRDNISLLEDDEAVDQFSIDILNNDLTYAADDGVEADFCFHNCRIMRNRLTNVFIGLSSQPGLGGPTYFIRNTLYNVAHVAFKLYRGSYGDVLLHNTVVKGGNGFAVQADTPVGQLYSRNNLFIGGPGATTGGYSSGAGNVMQLATVVT